MSKLFQINNIFLAGLLFISCMAEGFAESTNKEASSIQSLEVSMVNFYITSIVRVGCDNFTKFFGNETKNFFVHDKDNIRKFYQILNELKPVRSGGPDTRARVLIHYKTGQTDTLCVANTGISLNGKPMLSSKKMVNFIKTLAKKQTN